MFKKSKSKVLVDYASEEDDMSWHHHHSYKGKEGEEEEDEAVFKEAKVKKIMSKKERREKKMFSSKDDEHLLLTGEKQVDRRGCNKKVKDDGKEKDKPEKGHCFWDSVTMTMRQISPTKKLEKMEGWDPPQIGTETESETEQASKPNGHTEDLQVSSPNWLEPQPESDSWASSGLEEDSSRYANLSDSNNSTNAVTWTARAKGKLAGISRMSRGIGSENAWEGLK